MSFDHQHNCTFIFVSEYYNPNQYEHLQVDPDISGIGVVTNFIATAYITWTLFFLNYVFAYEASNPIDIHTVAWIRRVTGIKTRHPRVSHIFEECILSMCDLQIMTGFALLFCGFILAFDPSEPLSSYHWFLIVCLAWFSAITHLAGLSILRTYFDDRPRLKTTRIILMFVLLVVLIIALFPTGYFNWLDSRSAAAPQSPAICFFDISTASRLWHEAKDHPTYPYSLTDSGVQSQEAAQTPAMQQMVLAVLLLVMGFTSRCIKLFRPLTQTIRLGIRKPAHDCFAFIAKKLVVLLLHQPAKNISLVSVTSHVSLWDRFWIVTVFIPLFGLFLAFRVLADLISSMIAEIMWVLIALIWGTLKFLVVLSSAKFVYDDNRRWTFGQMMAVALLASPIFSLMWKFGELATQIENKNTAQDQQPLNVNIEQSIHEISESTSVPATQERFQHATASQPDLFDNDVHTDSVSMVMNRDYYSTAPWIWPAIVQSYFPPIATAFMALFFASVVYFVTMTEFWITSFHILPYVLLGFPAACACTMTAGLTLDQWYSNKSGWKWNLIFWAGLSIHGFYCFIFFADWLHVFEPLPTPYIILPCLVYIMYSLCGGLVIIGREMKSYQFGKRAVI